MEAPTPMPNWEIARPLAQADEAVVHRLAALAYRRLAGLVEEVSGDDARKAGNRAGRLLDRFAGNGSRLDLETLLDEVGRDLTRRRQAREALADELQASGREAGPAGEG